LPTSGHRQLEADVVGKLVGLGDVPKAPACRAEDVPGLIEIVDTAQIEAGFVLVVLCLGCLPEDLATQLQVVCDLAQDTKAGKPAVLAIRAGIPLRPPAAKYLPLAKPLASQMGRYFSGLWPLLGISMVG
jgi:hypothetical protein